MASNLHSLACSAPPEVLCAIFHIVRRDVIHRIRTPGLDALGKPRNLLAVTWTCQSWRLAALGDPTLWNTIFDHFSRGLEEWMMQHASPCPLIVHANHRTSSSSLLPVLALINQIASFGEFYLGIGANCDQQESKSVVRAIKGCSSMPFLRVFDLLLLHAASVDDADFSEVSMPNLWCLRLGLSGTWTSVVFPSAPSLTSLALYDWRSLGAEDVHRTMSFITKRYPALVSLTLTAGINQFVSPSDLLVHPVSFPALELLCIYGTATQMSNLATYFRIPRSCKFTADISIIQSDSVWDVAAARELQHLLYTRTDGPFSAYSTGIFDFTDESFVVMLYEMPPSLRSALGWRAAVEDVRADVTCSLPMPACVILNWTDMHLRGNGGWLRQCHTLLPLQHLRTVVIQAAPLCFTDFAVENILAGWKAFLQHMPRVETLRINEWALNVFTLLTALARDTPVLLPSLRHLVVDGIGCADERSGWSWSNTYILDLEERMKRARLEQISLSTCGLHSDCENLVAHIVEEYKEKLRIPVLLRKSPFDDIQAM